MDYIFNIGLNKCGTQSLHQALNFLNIPSIHYKYNKKVLRNIVRKNLNNKQNLFNGLDQIYRGFLAFNGEYYYDILYKQYPNAKFIFTSRDKEQFIRSQIDWELNLNSTISVRRLRSQLDKKYNQKDKILNFFKDKSNFLEIKICNGEGWEVLCPFLNKEIPNVPFPYLNKTLYKK